MKVGFYVLGKKGFIALERFLEKFSSTHVAFVMAARDSDIENDFHTEISGLCGEHGLKFNTRGKACEQGHIDAEFSFAIGWKWVIKEVNGLIVFHDSLLPRYRGFSPLVNMLIDGEDEIGVTALIASDEYDKGDVIYQEKTPINYPLKIHDAIDKVSAIYAELVLKTATDIFDGSGVKGFPQDENLASYSLWRDERDYFINWAANADEISRFVDAVGSPYRGARSVLNGQAVWVHDVTIVRDVIVENRASNIGKIIFIENALPVVVCGMGLIKITDLRTEDGCSVIGHMKFRSRFEGGI
ncbi:MAG: formyltransferase family protein [Marinobacter sp.]|uniref:formyltransferase family protein n=1 Tax=Marinobacter sp. TaxID=50741 RepID=UPI0034A01B87